MNRPERTDPDYLVAVVASHPGAGSGEHFNRAARALTKPSEAVTHKTSGYNTEVNRSTARHSTARHGTQSYRGIKINADMGILNAEQPHTYRSIQITKLRCVRHLHHFMQKSNSKR